MPRKARIDAPGAVHHLIARGIERGEIFQDDFDGTTFWIVFPDFVYEGFFTLSPLPPLFPIHGSPLVGMWLFHLDFFAACYQFFVAEI